MYVFRELVCLSLRLHVNAVMRSRGSPVNIVCLVIICVQYNNHSDANNATIHFNRCVTPMGMTFVISRRDGLLLSQSRNLDHVSYNLIC